MITGHLRLPKLFSRFRRHPGFTISASFTLAVGIALTTTAFSLVDGVLLKPLPYPQPERLVTITSASRTGIDVSPGCRTDQWLRWQREAKSFDSISGYFWSFDFLVSNDGSESINGLDVTPGYFRTTGLQPLLGREFIPGDYGTTNNGPVSIILGNNLWRRRFNGDPAIVGQSIKLGRTKEPLTIVGVMPPGVRFLPAPTATSEPNYDPDGLVDYWLPITPENKNWDDWSVIGRLSKQSTLATAQAELRVISEIQARESTKLEGITARVQSLIPVLNQQGEKVLTPIVCAVALVFVIACANVSGLLLVRGLRRQSEFALRSALGASRWMIVGQVLREGLPLGLLGGVLGVGLTVALIRGLKVFGTDIIPRVDAVTANWTTLGFYLSASIAAALVASLMPALRASSALPVDVLKADGVATGISRGERRLLSLVAAAQIAVTVALLFGAGLLIRTVNHLLIVNAGFDTTHVLTLSVTEPTGSKWLDFHTRTLDKIKALPGVQHAAFAWGVPLTGNHWTATYEVVGNPHPKPFNEWPLISTRAVTSDYFATMGISVIQGRTFRDNERWDETHSITNVPWVVIVNEAFVKRQMPDGTGVGGQIRFRNNPDRTCTIIGVVSNARTSGLELEPSPELYFTMWQVGPFTKHLVVRTAADPDTMVAAIRTALREVDPTVAIENIRTMDQLRNASIAPQVFIARMLVALSLAASLLAVVGVYDVIAHTLGRRRRELAIRVAIGATPRDVLVILMRDTAKLATAGLLSGLVIAIVLARFLHGYLFDVGTVDPCAVMAGLVGAGVLSILAAFLPARRAINVEPMSELRGQ